MIELLLLIVGWVGGSGLLAAAHLGETGQGAILGGLHDLAFAGPLVVDADEVEDAVNDDAVELVVVVLAELPGIGAHGVEADEEVAAHNIALAIVEGDDVGVVVVPQVLAVDLKNLVIVAEDVGHVAHTLAVGAGHVAHPGRGLAMRDGGHLDIDGVV